MECPRENVEQNLPVKLKCVHVKNFKNCAREKLKVSVKKPWQIFESTFFCRGFLYFVTSKLMSFDFLVSFRKYSHEKNTPPWFCPREILNRTREKIPKSRREKSGQRVKISEKVPVKMIFAPVKKIKKRAKNTFHGHF